MAIQPKNAAATLNEADCDTGSDNEARQEFENGFEQWMGQLLRIGVFSSAAVVLLGGVLYLRTYGRLIPQYHQFHGEASNLRSIEGIIRRALTGDGQGIAQAGLLLLIATPIARVIFSAIGFLRERDFLYMAVTLVVLGVLMYGLLGQQ